MSTMFWNALKVSPALLGASLLVASSTYAAQKAPDATSAIAPSQAVTSVQAAVEPGIELSETLVKSTSVVEPEAQLSKTAVEEPSVSQLMPLETKPTVNLAQSLPESEATTSDSSDPLEQIERYSTEGNSESVDQLEQVTNVSQLRDVSPGDWAYEALRSLVERYGCIAGYPDGTYRGNRATTRYEFAAGLNACLNQIERLIGDRPDAVTREDLETLQRLVQEFQAELTTLGTRVDDLEGRVGFLEDHQFSTTTKLNGEVIFAINDLFGGEDNVLNADFDDNTVFQDRVRLNFDSSFTGKDRLRTRLQARNVLTFPALTNSGITREGRLGFEGNEGNDIRLDFLGYRAPVGPVLFQLFANAAGLDDVATTLNPLDSSGGGSISRFGQRNAIYRVGGQNAGASLTYGAEGPIRLDVGYLAGNPEEPGQDGGIFNGSYSALGQLTFQPSKAFRVAATYINAYNTNTTGNGGDLAHGTGSIASNLRTSRPIASSSYGIEASFAFSPQIILSGWVGYTDATVIGRGKADIWNYAATLALNDLGSEGSTLGFVVGVEPKLTDADSAIGIEADDDTGFHVEGFYKLRVSDNIAITPGVIWLTSPGHNDDNDDIFVGTLRTTFTF